MFTRLFRKKLTEGFCVFGSLDLIDNESSLRITARAAPGIDNRSGHQTLQPAPPRGFLRGQWDWGLFR